MLPYRNIRCVKGTECTEYRRQKGTIILQQQASATRMTCRLTHKIARCMMQVTGINRLNCRVNYKGWLRYT